MGDRRWSDGLLESGFGDPRTAEVVGWPARVERMVEVEAALGRALAKAGLVSDEAAEEIARACDPARLNLDDLAVRAATAPTPVIPLVRALTEGAGGRDALAAAWLHHGATSQDVLDTAVVLQVRAALVRLEAELLAVADRCAELAEQHRDTVMAGRTLGQQAVPITFGLKAARWLGVFDRRLEQLRWLRPRLLVVQCGGAAGTSAVYGDKGPAVTEALADELGLAVPDLPWHGERDRIVELAGALAAVATATAGTALDLVLLAQSEVGEVREAPGPGPSSSALPHKRNPADATAARAASWLALGELQTLLGVAGEHEHERAAGAWQVEWVALPSALVRTVGAVVRLREALSGLEVDAERAADNLERQLGLSGSEALASALTPVLGRRRAQELTGELATAAVTQGRPLGVVAGNHAEVAKVLGRRELDAVLDPAASLQSVAALVERALSRHDRIRRERS